MPRDTRKNKTREIKLFDNSPKNLKELKNIAPFGKFIYDGDVLEKELKELAALYSELAASDRKQVLSLARALKKAAARTSAPDIYGERAPGEAIEDFIIRQGLRPPVYPKDGKIIDFLRKNYRDSGLLDGVLFTRATLRKLDPGADQALQNWLRNNTMPADLKIPNKKGRAEQLVANLSHEELLAATSVIKNRQRHARLR